jgi:hypothetical protein
MNQGFDAACHYESGIGEIQCTPTAYGDEGANAKQNVGDQIEIDAQPVFDFCHGCLFLLLFMAQRVSSKNEQSAHEIYQPLSLFFSQLRWPPHSRPPSQKEFIRTTSHVIHVLKTPSQRIM